MGLAGRSVLEWHVSAERRETLGRIDEAWYLGEAEVGFWSRLLGRRGAALLRPPFDAAGGDAFGLLTGAHPELDGQDDPLGSIRLARGQVGPLSPREEGDDTPVRDAWTGSVRVVRATHFGLLVPGQAPVAVAFAQSPLVIAAPTRATLGDVVAGTEQESWAARHLPWHASEAADLVTLKVGEEVEVLGIVTTPDQCRGRFDLTERRASYRDAPEERVALVVGDRQGLRMVLRRCG